MFSQEYRIPKGDFPLLSGAISRHSSFFSVSYVAGRTNRFAVIVSKKCAKDAVVRNKNRRRVRHALAKLVYVKTGYYAVFLKKDLSRVEFKILTEELQKLITTL